MTQPAPGGGGIHDVAAAGFGAGAEDYERGRPSYAEDVVAWLVDHLGIGPGRRVVDLAAGTGKLTRLLVPTGADLVAVEPVPAMRDQLRTTVPGVVAVDGTAERLSFDDGSIDAVTVAQAFHWFDAERAVAEIGRVLCPGGALGLVWNERDVAEPWVAELSRLIRWDERERWRVPYTVEVDWGARMDAIDSPFAPGEHLRSGFRQSLDPETLVARVLSTSYLATLAADLREELAREVRALVAPLGDRFDLPYVTYAWAFTRR